MIFNWLWHAFRYIRSGKVENNWYCEYNFKENGQNAINSIIMLISKTCKVSIHIARKYTTNNIKDVPHMHKYTLPIKNEIFIEINIVNLSVFFFIKNAIIITFFLNLFNRGFLYRAINNFIGNFIRCYAYDFVIFTFYILFFGCYFIHLISNITIICICFQLINVFISYYFLDNIKHLMLFLPNIRYSYFLLLFFRSLVLVLFILIWRWRI